MTKHWFENDKHLKPADTVAAELEVQAKAGATDPEYHHAYQCGAWQATYGDLQRAYVYCLEQLRKTEQELSALQIAVEAHPDMNAIYEQAEADAETDPDREPVTVGNAAA
jgi:hypothetical protein